MQIQETIEVPVSRDTAWHFLWDVQRLAACLPGCKGVVEVEPQRSHTVSLEDAIGPYKVHFDVAVLVLESVEGQAVKLLATGQDKRLGATVRNTLSVSIEEGGPLASRLKFDGDVEVLGKIASLGQFAIKRKVNDVMAQFARNIQAALDPSRAEASHV